MADSLFPDDDAGILERARAFASGIASSPSTYALGAAEAAAITEAVDDYAQKLAIAASPLTRTPGAINAKDTARNGMMSFLRVQANLIRANQGISDQAKIDIGIRPRKRGLTRRNCPQTSPRLGLVAATPGQFTLSFTDSIVTDAKYKPFGATRLELFAMVIEVGDEAPASPMVPGEGAPAGATANWAWYVGSFTKNPIVVRQPAPLRPMLAVYWGRWASHRGEVGPWSLALPTMIVGRCAQSPTAQQGDGQQQQQQQEQKQKPLKFAA